MHSSRMHTVHNSSRLLEEGVYLVPGLYLVLGGVPDSGGYLVLGGVPGPGDVYLVPRVCTWSRGSVPGPRAVYLVQEGCTWFRGCTWSQGVPGPGGIPGPRGLPAQVLPPVVLVQGGYLPRYSPFWTDRHM